MELKLVMMTARYLELRLGSWMEPLRECTMVERKGR